MPALTPEERRVGIGVYDGNQKFCKSCGEHHPKLEKWWSKHFDRKMNKFYLRCKEQYRLYMREHANKERIKIQREKNYKSYPTTLKGKFAIAKHQAKLRGKQWAISFDEYSALIALKCHYCVKPLGFTYGTSLDRKDNKIGYFPGNVVPCCSSCNQIRNVHLTVEEMIVAMRAVLELRASKKQI